VSGIALATPYLDTRADQLTFSLGRPPRPALAVAVADLGDGPGGPAVELRLLGASHQVLAGPVAETLACEADAAGGGPPPLVERRIGGLAYRFASRVRACGRAELSARVAALWERLAGEPHALCGVFPGSPDAVTALRAARAADGALTWRTWHVYPQAGQIVETRTRLGWPVDEERVTGRRR
jgi:hypothetical protein